jgi:glycosyltransferase involved in cell wall biosynthesis
VTGGEQYRSVEARRFPELAGASPDVLEDLRATPEFLEPYERSRPLVTVCVATCDRADLLVDRCVASLRRQSYPDLQIVVVGDHCTDHTERRLASIGDDRIVFENLGVRGPYPREGKPRWHVAGTHAMNRALQLAEGDFVCHLDDDDEVVSTRVERLVDAARSTKAEFLWHRFSWEIGDGQWKTLGIETPAVGHITSGSIFYHSCFTSIRWDLEAYKHNEPGDWNRAKQILALAPRTLFLPDVLTLHYRERAQTEFEPKPGEMFIDV